jgi:hypothetical protein
MLPATWVKPQRCNPVPHLGQLKPRPINRRGRLNARQLALVGKDPKENISERHRRKEFSMTQHSHSKASTQFVDTANFAARDENVRCLSYGVLRKLAGLSRDLFADYWRDVLGTLCARLPGIIEIGFASALAAREFCESETYRAIIEDQRRYLRSVGAFRVIGVYTYVRDGVISTAGWRGSRTVEFIERVGAVNQTRDEVTRRSAQDPHR